MMAKRPWLAAIVALVCVCAQEADEAGTRLVPPGQVPTDRRGYSLKEDYCWLLAHSCKFSFCVAIVRWLLMGEKRCWSARRYGWMAASVNSRSCSRARRLPCQILVRIWCVCCETALIGHRWIYIRTRSVDPIRRRLTTAHAVQEEPHGRHTCHKSRRTLGERHAFAFSGRAFLQRQHLQHLLLLCAQTRNPRVQHLDVSAQRKGPGVEPERVYRFAWGRSGGAHSRGSNGV